MLITSVTLCEFTCWSTLACLSAVNTVINTGVRDWGRDWDRDWGHDPLNLFG